MPFSIVIFIKKRDMIKASEFETHFRTYFDQLYRLANHLLNDADESRDAVHEVFAQLWESQPSIEPGKIRDYLVRSTYNRCLNRIKHKGKFTDIQSSYIYELKNSLRGDSFDHELWTQIQTFIQTDIPPRTREALNLCFGEELSYKEAAERMHIGIDAINKHIVTGLRMLRERFRNKR